MKFSVAKSALVPFDAAALKYLPSRRVGEVLTVTVLDESEQKFRSFVFMALNKVAHAAGISLDDMRARLQIETGRFQIINTKTRTVCAVKSMNVMSMSHDDLKDFWDDARPLIEEMLPTFNWDDAQEINQLLNA